MNNNTGTRKLTLNQMGVRLAQTTRELSPAAQAHLFFTVLEDLMTKPVGALGRAK